MSRSIIEGDDGEDDMFQFDDNDDIKPAGSGKSED